MSSAEIVLLISTIQVAGFGLIVWLGRRYLVRQREQAARLQSQVRSLTDAKVSLQKQLARARDHGRKCYDYGVHARQKLEQGRRVLADLNRRLAHAQNEPRPDPRLAILQGQVAELE